MHRRLLAVAVCATCSCTLLPGASPSEPELRVDTTLVLIPVAVTDASNHFVLNLEKNNFSLYEDGVKQRISQFAGEDAPLSVGLLVDVSGSIGAKLAISQKAVAEFLKTTNTEDEEFLVEFGDRANVTVGFTRNTDDIEERLRLAQSQGLTALLDAVHLALGEMKKAKNPRKALLMISDGGDNHSRYGAAEIKQVVREADVQIYAMGVFEPVLFAGLTPTELSGPQLLAEIAEQTGGRVFPARSLSALPSIARRIGIELRNEYVLAYSPSNVRRDGTYRKVEVKVDPPAGLSALKARWREGYYAPAQ